MPDVNKIEPGFYWAHIRQEWTIIKVYDDKTFVYLGNECEFPTNRLLGHRIERIPDHV